MPNPQVSNITVDGVTYDLITPMAILSYGTSTWAEFLEAYNDNRVVYCRASSDSNPATGDQKRLAFMAYVNKTGNNDPTSVEFQYYRSVSPKSSSQPNDQVFVYTLTNSNSWSVTTRDTLIYPTGTDSATTGISISDHSTGSVTGVQSSTTSVTGVQSTTTTASKVTLGTEISVPNPSASNVTVPIKNTSSTTVPIKNASATTIPNVTNVGSGSFTQGSFSGGSLTLSLTNDNTGLIFNFTPATHGTDTHTHTAPTLGTDISIIGVQSSTTSVTGVQSSTTTASKVTFGTEIDIPNVTNVSDVTVPIKATSATTVPIKNTSATTVVTSATHTVTDNGHTHTI